MVGAASLLGDIFLAYRQAKTALYYERRGCGLEAVAKYELNLRRELGSLVERVASDVWFDGLEIGKAWVAPKRLDYGELREDWPTVGLTDAVGQLAVQPRLSPHPAFATIEVLYLWKYGVYLDSLISDDSVGYRLASQDGRISRTKRWLFGYWPAAYNRYRIEPIQNARKYLSGGVDGLTATKVDIQSFYNGVCPDFLLSGDLIERLGEIGLEDREGYVRATRSLLRAYSRYRRSVRYLLGSSALSDNRGVPIGALTSRVVSNLCLASLDSHIRSNTEVLCLRRYVDDISIVSKGIRPAELHSHLNSLLPVKPGGHDDAVMIDSDAIGRPGSRLALNPHKIRVVSLSGDEGDLILSDAERQLAEYTSRNATFVDPVVFGRTRATRDCVGCSDTNWIVETRSHSDHRLSRSLARVSRLVAPTSIHQRVSDGVRAICSKFQPGNDWVAAIDPGLELLKVSLAAKDWASCRQLCTSMDRVFSTIETLRGSATNLVLDGRLQDQQSRPWTSLRNYLHERRLEAIASTLPWDAKASEFRLGFPEGLRYRSGIVGLTALRNRAELLSFADFRSLDFEDDHHQDRRLAVSDEEPWAEIGNLAERWHKIQRFVDACVELKDQAWPRVPSRLFLCTRPPSFFDVARRQLSRVTDQGIPLGCFDVLLDTVNAVRGTEYSVPFGKRLGPWDVELDWKPPRDLKDGELPEHDPLIVLGNLRTSDEYWEGAANRQPVCSIDRLQELSKVMDDTRSAALKVPFRQVMLVLPELSIPRRWLRPIAQYVQQRGEFAVTMGLEYFHRPKKQIVLNQAMSLFPGPLQSMACLTWNKRNPAVSERTSLARRPHPLGFEPFDSGSESRIVVHTSCGRMSVLICSELVESRLLAKVLGRVELLVCPAWNRDTTTFDSLVRSVGIQLNSVVAIANVSLYSDCRIWAPRSRSWERDVCRLIERGASSIVSAAVRLRSLYAYHREGAMGLSAGGFTSSDYKRSDGEWKPLPPDWPVGGLT